jgi:adenine deaminase
MKISGNIIDLERRRIFKGEMEIEKEKILSIVPRETSNDVFILPGLIDAHVHIESSMVAPSHFAVTAVKHGTIAVVSDPHEIANVKGLEGIRFMIQNASNVPLKFCFGAPSCVPATQFENSGASVSPANIEELFKDGDVKYLSEMMNFPGVVYGDKEVWEKIRIAGKFNAKIDGHAPGLTGENLKIYINAGISTDHECSNIKEAEEKISLGMKILIREGSAAKNMTALAPLIRSHPENVMICTDDLHPENLESGHINKLVSRLIIEGYDIFDVLKVATINPIQHYGLNIGTLKPGDNADFIIVDNPENMNVLQTWIDGTCVYDGDRALFSPGTVNHINKFNCSRINENDIKIKNEGSDIRVIVAYNGELYTGTETFSPGEIEEIISDPGKDILKIVVKERYNDAPPAVGFIKGFGLRKGAFATSVAHDSHNIIAVGCTDREIVNAINMIVDAHGGMSVSSEEKSNLLKLPIAGLMSDNPVSVVAGKYRLLTETVRSLGCRMDSPFMTLSFMALLVIPELKLSDKGLFDGKQFKHVSLFVS